MKLVFITNALTPHQLPFCDELFKILGNDFKLITTNPLSQERINMGWEIFTRSYELMQYENDEVKKLCNQLILDADVVLLGSADDKNIASRLRQKKLTFRYSERLYKHRLSFKNFIYYGISAYLHHGRFQKYPLYMLCASAYTANDMNIFGNYNEKMYKWGYFPMNIGIDFKELLNFKQNEITKILWVGRFVKWKHANHAIEAIRELKQTGYKFEMNIIGGGECEDSLKNLVSQYKLENEVKFLGVKEPRVVRQYMINSNIFLFTSSYQEGWGAVLNEAMNSGCAVIASHAVGSAPFLINHGENGLIYRYGDIEELSTKIKVLLEDFNLQKKLAFNAYQTINNLWNSSVAATRFIELSKNLLDGSDILFDEGPCSKAPIIKENKMYNYMMENCL